MKRIGAEPRLSPAYWRLLWAAGIDNIGDGAFAAAIPLLAVTITRDPRLVSIISAATYLPWMLLSLPAGALVDRHDRVALMWRSQAIQAVLVGAVAVLTAFGHLGIPTLAVLAFGLGACEVVFGNAAQAILPDIVAKPLLHKANGNQQAIVTVGQLFVGPPVGSCFSRWRWRCRSAWTPARSRCPPRCWRPCPDAPGRGSSTRRCERRSRTDCAG